MPTPTEILRVPEPSREREPQRPKDDRPDLAIIEAEPEPVAVGKATEANRKKGGVNEDATLADTRAGTFAVLDGMGGHAAGERASAIGAELLGEALRRMPDTVRHDGARAADFLRDRMLEVSRTMKELADAFPKLAGMGATCSLVQTVEDPTNGRPREVVIGQLGDSRVYRLRQGNIERLTKDQSGVQDLMDQGQLPQAADQFGNPEADALTSDAQRAVMRKYRNLISGGLGMPEQKPPEVTRVALEEGDVLILTSDGVHDNLTDREIADIAARFADDPDALSRELAAASRARADGGHVRSKDDDASAVAIRFDRVHREVEPSVAEPAVVAERREPTMEVPTEDIVRWEALPTDRLRGILVQYRKVLDGYDRGAALDPMSVSRAHGLRDRYVAALTAVTAGTVPPTSLDAIRAEDQRYKQEAARRIEQIIDRRAV